MQEKNIIITGGNAGIGFETSVALAKKGGNIFIVSRNKEKAAQAVLDIKQISGNKNVDYLIADLSSQKSIRELNNEVRKRLDRVDILVNNAGGVFPEFKKTADGLEMTIATNHFAYFLFTNLLLDLLKKGENSRIVNVSSRSHLAASIDFESFTTDKGYFILKAYGQSKLANILFTAELARRLKDTGITVNSLHPGLVKTDIGTKKTNWYSSLLWSLYSKIGGVSVAQGAATSIYLASSPEVQNTSGKYFAKCKEITPSKLARNAELQKELWKVSEQYCPLS